MAATVSVPVVLPASVVSFAKVTPAFVDTCHCTVGAGMPEAAAVKLAPSPAITVLLAGFELTAELRLRAPATRSVR